MKKYGFKATVGLFIIFSLYVFVCIPTSYMPSSYEKKCLRELGRVYWILQNHPYENRDEISKRMIEAAIEAMAPEIDEHTRLLSKEETQESRSEFEKGSYGGVGIVISQKMSWEIENVSDLKKLKKDFDPTGMTAEKLKSISHFEKLLLNLGDKIKIMGVFNSKGEAIDKNIMLAMHESDPGDQLVVHIEAADKNFIITASKHLGDICIVQPMKDSLAEKAGLKPDDIILGAKDIGDKDFLLFKNRSVKYARGKIVGPVGTTVRLKIKREDKILEIPITRTTVKLSMMEENRFGDVGYIKFNSFTAGSAKEFEKKLKELSDTKVLIIDLRDNGGGLLNEVLAISDFLTPKGKEILTYLYKDEKEIVLTKKNSPYKKPIIVYTNAGSASASEILAGILKYHKRAIIVGENTYGKGTVQSTPYGSLTLRQLRHTIAEYRIIGGDGKEYKINGIGIKPDVEIDPETRIEDILKNPKVIKYLNK